MVPRAGVGQTVEAWASSSPKNCCLPITLQPPFQDLLKLRAFLLLETPILSCALPPAAWVLACLAAPSRPVHIDRQLSPRRVLIRPRAGTVVLGW